MKGEEGRDCEGEERDRKKMESLQEELQIKQSYLIKRQGERITQGKITELYIQICKLI